MGFNGAICESSAESSTISTRSEKSAGFILGGRGGGIGEGMGGGAEEGMGGGVRGAKPGGRSTLPPASFADSSGEVFGSLS